MSLNKFKEYEVLKINTAKFRFQEINGSICTVQGVDADPIYRYIYSVSVELDDDLVWCIPESDLQSTGKHKKRSDFFTDETVKVLVDPDTGEGYLPEEE